MPIQVRRSLTTGHDARDYNAMDGVGGQRKLAGGHSVTGLFPLDNPATD
jgi:hypothetical protein